MRNASWIVLLSLSATAAFAQEKTIEPGFYEIVTRSAAGSQTARACLTAKDVTNGFTPPLEPGCKRTRSVVADGKLDIATTCPDSTTTMTGTYTATGYAMDGKITMKGDDDPMVMESHVTAKRLAESCKGG